MRSCGKYDLESRGFAFFCTRSHEQQETTQQLCEYLLRGIMLVLKDMPRFLFSNHLDLILSFTLSGQANLYFFYTDKWNDIRK